MKSNSTYAGVDWSCSTDANIDPNTSIRYGVISQHTPIPDALADFELNYPEPEAETCPECSEEEVKVKEWGDEATCPHCGHEWEVEMPDMVDSCGMFYDEEGYNIEDCLDSDLIITKSPYYTYAQFCSPCIPGAGNLDHPFPINDNDKLNDASLKEWAEKAEGLGWAKCYCLGRDWFDSESACPYDVMFLVEDNTPVFANTTL